MNAICKLCGKPIEGVAPATYFLQGVEFHLMATVHSKCQDKFLEQEAKRKPYRQPLEGQPNRRQMSIEPEIQDWDNL